MPSIKTDSALTIWFDLHIEAMHMFMNFVDNRVTIIYFYLWAFGFYAMWSLECECQYDDAEEKTEIFEMMMTWLWASV
jgi:hypothetical protein